VALSIYNACFCFVVLVRRWPAHNAVACRTSSLARAGGRAGHGGLYEPDRRHCLFGRDLRLRSAVHPGAARRLPQHSALGSTADGPSFTRVPPVLPLCSWCWWCRSSCASSRAKVRRGRARARGRGRDGRDHDKGAADGVPVTFGSLTSGKYSSKGRMVRAAAPRPLRREER
jgi:hypothetical protein